MKQGYFILVFSLFLSGCATKMTYVNISRMPEEISRDKDACQARVNASDLKDPQLKANKLNQCMSEKGYKVVSEEEALKIQGFQQLWVKSGAELKSYEVAFIDTVDVSKIKVGDTLVPGTKVTREDMDNLAKKMLDSFSKCLNEVMPVVSDKEAAAGKKALYVSMKLNNVSPADIGLNTALEAAGRLTPVPLPDAPGGAFSFEGVIADLSSDEKLVIFSDECKEDKNESLLGLEKFEKWKHAHNIIDYWADHLAALLAKERGQEYKSRLGFKVIDF